MTRLVPKNCIVSSVELDGRGNADVRYRCERDGMMEMGQHTYHKPGGAIGNYPSKRVKARSVRFRGAHMSGAGRLDFVLSPASAMCHKDGSEISCKLFGDTSSPSLAGARRRRRR